MSKALLSVLDVRNIPQLINVYLRSAPKVLPRVAGFKKRRGKRITAVFRAEYRGCCVGIPFLNYITGKLEAPPSAPSAPTPSPASPP